MYNDNNDNKNVQLTNDIRQLDTLLLNTTWAIYELGLKCIAQ